jgi:hypothetical protein
LFINNIIKILFKEKEKIENEAIKLSLKLNKKNPVFYSSSFFYPLAYRLQTSLEEDSKVICHSNKITELFHNEIECYPNKDYFAYLIIDKKELKNFSKQIKFFKKRLKEHSEFYLKNTLKKRG